MASKIKNIIIFTIVMALLILIYIFFIKKSSDSNNLISSTNTDLSTVNTLNQNSSITNDLLSILLSVKNIKLDDSIFSNPAFINLRDSSILLNPTGDEGRPNPFAPIGFENTTTPAPIIPVNSFIQNSPTTPETSGIPTTTTPNSSTTSTPTTKTPTTKTPPTKTPTVNKSTPTTP